MTPGSPEVMRLRAELSQIASIDEIAAWFDAHRELADVQIDYFHACLAHARAERVDGLESYCRAAWQAMWRTPLSHERYVYLAYGPNHAERRRLAYERMLTEQFYDPAVSTLAIIGCALRLIRQTTEHVFRDGSTPSVGGQVDDGSRGQELRGPANAAEAAALTEAFKLFAKILDARLKLDALERGLVMGARGQFVTPTPALVRQIR